MISLFHPKRGKAITEKENIFKKKDLRKKCKEKAQEKKRLDRHQGL